MSISNTAILDSEINATDYSALVLTNISIDKLTDITNMLVNNKKIIIENAKTREEFKMYNINGDELSVDPEYLDSLYYN